MKRFTLLSIVLLLAAAANTTVQAQNPDKTSNRKEQKEAQKLDKQLEMAQLMDSLILEKSFQFNAEEIGSRTGQRHFLSGYQALKIFPGRYYIIMAGSPRTDGFFRHGTYQSLELKDNIWLITIEMDYHTGILSYEFAIERLTGKAAVRMRNKNSVPTFYVGNIYPN